MKSMMSRFAALLIYLSLVAMNVHAAEEYINRYGLTPDSKALDFGAQPLSYPNGVIGAVMQRDRQLRVELASLQTPLSIWFFKRGADMLEPIAERRLDAGFIGDMPATNPAAAGQIWIVGLVEVSLNAILIEGGSRVEDLAGKRIGYTAVSTAHSSLMRALNSAKLSTADVTLIPLLNADLPDALARKEIDAFAGWEPAISLALAANPKNRIVFQGQSVDYFVISREFERSSPESARALVAGYVRAIEWMRQNPANLETAARWVLADGRAFSGSDSELSVDQIASITRRGILNVPSAPVIIKTAGEQLLKAEYDLLKGLAKLPAAESWENVESSFAYEGLRDVLADPRKYRLRTFDYDK